MGEYRLSINFQLQIGAMFSLNKYRLRLAIPFITIRLSFSKYANGYHILGKNIN